MTEGELLQRIARLMRGTIGPAMDAEYPKTQAFMVGVVLQKLGRQLELAPQHQAQTQADLDALIAALREMLPASTPPPLAEALATLQSGRDKAALAGVVEALYQVREALGEESFAGLLGRVRVALRAQVDREMECAQ